MNSNKGGNKQTGMHVIYFEIGMTDCWSFFLSIDLPPWIITYVAYYTNKALKFIIYEGFYILFEMLKKSHANYLI